MRLDHKRRGLANIWHYVSYIDKLQGRTGAFTSRIDRLSRARIQRPPIKLGDADSTIIDKLACASLASQKRCKWNRILIALVHRRNNVSLMIVESD